MLALVPETENPLVKLPENANYTTQRPSLDDNILSPSLVELPTSIESDVIEPRRRSALELVSELIVRLPKPTERHPANTAGSSVTVQSLSSAQTRSFFDVLFGTGTTRRQHEHSRALFRCL